MDKPSTCERQLAELRALLRDQGWTSGDIDLDKLQQLLVERKPRLFAGGLNRDDVASLLTAADMLTVFEQRGQQEMVTRGAASLAGLLVRLKQEKPGIYRTWTVEMLGAALRKDGVRVGTIRIGDRTAKGIKREWLDEARDRGRTGPNS